MFYNQTPDPDNTEVKMPEEIEPVKPSTEAEEVEK